jgi:alkylated DNA nucleotide flippase Atl1
MKTGKKLPLWRVIRIRRRPSTSQPSALPTRKTAEDTVDRGITDRFERSRIMTVRER